MRELKYFVYLYKRENENITYVKDSNTNNRGKRQPQRDSEDEQFPLEALPAIGRVVVSHVLNGLAEVKSLKQMTHEEAEAELDRL